MKITSIDFSSTVIERMKELNDSAGRVNMQWIEMDMLAMTFPSHTFDVVIDKAALDSLLVDEGDVWDPVDTVKAQGHTFCSEVSRVLNPNGTFLQLSFAQPHFRTKYFMNSWTRISPYTALKGHCDVYSWDIDYLSIEPDEGCVSSYLYVLKKTGL